MCLLKLQIKLVAIIKIKIMKKKDLLMLLRRDSRGLRERVAVSPIGGAVEQSVEQGEGLRGDADAEAHTVSLYM